MKLASICTVTLVASLVIAQVFAADCPTYRFLVFSDTADRAAGLQNVVQQFKDELGGVSNGNALGPIGSGQRSINWDAPIVPFDMPGNFFNTVVPRGAVFTTRGREFRVSNPTASDEPTDNRFNSILPRSASRQFRRFSLERLFTPLKRNKVTTAFRIPGSDVKANTVGFGAVFADVDQSRATNMRYFDQDGCLIARVNVRPINRGLSFAGIIVQNGAGENIPAIARVSIKLGTISVEQFANRYAGSDNIGDLVVMDDLFYGEPQSQF